MRRLVAVMCAALLLGCRGAGPNAPAPAGYDLGLGSLVGAWRLAGIDGKDLDWPFGVAVVIDPTTIHAQTPCAPMRWRYAYEPTGALTSERLGGGDRAINESMQCAAGVLPQERQIAAVMAEVNHAAASPDGSITLTSGHPVTGGGRSLTLFRQ